MKNKHILLTLLLAVFISFTASAQHFWVPDVNLRNFLLQDYPTCFTNQDSLITTCDSIVQETSLSVSFLNISDLSGIQFFTSLKNFTCSNNSITSIDSLPDSLVYFMCSQNQLQSLPPLPSSLINLNCNLNQITSLPALPPALLYLDCKENNIDSLPSLPPNLRWLYCEANHLTTLPNLPNSLQIIYSGTNNLTQLPSLPTDLRILSVPNNQLTALPALPPKMMSLYCGFNLLDSLPDLPDTLYSLGCTMNSLSALPVLPSQLSVLICDNNQLNSLPALPNSLSNLTCSFNQISHLPTLPSNLAWLICSGNPIACLPALPNNLMNLYYDSTQITCIPNIPNNGNFFSFPHSNLCTPFYNACNYSYLRGFIYIDVNGNGLYDSAEVKMPGTINYLNSFASQSDSSGYFTFIVDSGSVNFSAVVPTYYTPTSPQTISYLVQANSNDTLAWGMQAITTVKDLKIDLDHYNSFRPGFKTILKIHYKNEGTQSIQNATLKFLNDTNLSMLSAQPLNTSASADTLIWNLGNLLPNQEGYISLLDSINVLAPIGTGLLSEALIFPFAGDTNTLNNVARCSDIITGSFDPNDKSVSPEFISPGQTNNLEYTIRFQNTGNDTAFSVLITDTLSNSLDYSTIKTISASHKWNYWLQNGCAKWYFPNILLPDSNVNEPASHGFIKFHIQPKSNLNAGNQIENTAAIYFDYNAAVATNTAIVSITPLVVEEYSFEKIKLFPNPVQDYFLLETKEFALGEVSLSDESGRCLDKKFITSSHFTWNSKHFPCGVYFLTGKNWNVKLIKN